MQFSASRTISIVRNAGRLVRHGLGAKFQQGPNMGSDVYFDCADPRLERYLYWLVKMFDLAGWRVMMKPRVWFLLNLRNCSEYVYDIKTLRFSTRLPKSGDLVITDRSAASDSIFVDTDYFRSEKDERSFSLPFFMHPDVYHTGLFRELPGLRTRSVRPIRVFLGGNLSDAYDTPVMRERFGLMNRSEVTRAVIDEFSGRDRFFEIRKPEDADAVLAGEIDADLVLMRRGMIPLRTWMQLLAASDFFIAPPGILMPFSHNIIEAMAVGSIPLTQYGHLFYPPLVDGETYIRFDHADELIGKLKMILEPGYSRTKELREKVIRYYQKHLEPVSVVRKIYESRNKIERLYLIAGHLSLEDLSSEARQ